MSKENSSGVQGESQVSAVGQTGSMGRSTSVSSGAAKVFREFKWGLLTLFLLMVVVVGLVYDGGSRKKSTTATKPADSTLDIALDGPAVPPAPPSVPGVAGDSLLGPVTSEPAHTPGASLAEAATPPALPTNPVYAAPLNPIAQPPAAPVSPEPLVAAPVTVPPPAGKTHKVQSGDTLSGIAQAHKLGKGGVKALIAANKTMLSDPNRLKVGMVLNIPVLAPTATTATPPATSTTKVATAETAKTEAAADAGEYTVQSGDTLERIARKVFNDGRRWQEIHNANRDQLPDPARLRVGQVLKIKASKAPAVKKVSEADVSEKIETKAEVVETPLPALQKEEVAVKKSVKREKHDEPQVEVMSATSSAFAP